MDSEQQRLARAAGVSRGRELRLEDVERRRSQLWLLSIIIGLAVPGLLAALGTDVVSEQLQGFADVRTLRLSLVALLVAFGGYVIERERALRRLTRMLLDERQRNDVLIGRVRELDTLLDACRALNSSLDLGTVLNLVARSAEQLGAKSVTVGLVTDEDPDRVVTVATRGATDQEVGSIRSVDEALHSSAGQRAVGLEARARLLGVLTVDQTDRGAERFDDRALQVYAEAAAAVIANAQSHVETQDKVRALTDAEREKDELLTIITHELRTPLTSLIGLVTTIGRGAERLTPDKLRELADVARAQGWRLDRLVEDMLQTSRAARGTLTVNLQETDLGTVVSDCVLGFEASSSEHRLDVRLPHDPVVRWADPDAVARIVGNLVTNAIKYTPPDTTVTVSLAVAADAVEITVADDGPGIPVDKRDAIFEKFQRGAQTGHGGLGLGLYICRALAKAHGGSVSYAPAERGGSIFTARLSTPVPESPKTIAVTAEH